MTPTDDVEDARVIVLNTCAIRENADHKLYGNLGHLKPLKAAPTCGSWSPGCLAQKDQGQIQERAPWVDVVVGPTPYRTCWTCCGAPRKPVRR